MINSYCLILSVSHSSLDFRHLWCSVEFGKGIQNSLLSEKAPSYLSWHKQMAFTWSPSNVSTTSWCQLKSTEEYSLTNASLEQMENCLNYTTGLIFKTLPKAQRTRGLSSAYQSNFFRSYHKFLTKPILNFIITWSINSKYWPNLENLVLKVWTKT